MKKLFTEIELFFARKIRENVRQPVWIMSGLLTPLLYILLFAPLLRNLSHPALTTPQILDTFVPGILTLLAFSTGMGSGWTIIHELETGVVERMRVTPAARFSMLAGSVLADIASFLVPAILVLVIAAFFGFEVHLAGLLVLLVMLCLLVAIVSAASTAIGLIVKQIGSLAAVVTTLQLPLTLLSGILLPISLGPLWLRVVAHVDPLYYTVEASRVLATGKLWATSIGVAWAVIVPLTVFVMAWATRVYRKAVA